MRGWNFAVARVFGVEVRLHVFLALLLAVGIATARVEGMSGGRGAMLWLCLLAALVVRETARAMMAAWVGLEVRSILLLPTGGMLSYADGRSTELAALPGVQTKMAVVGPVANVVCGMVLAGLMLTVTPTLRLWELPWVSAGHLLRAAVWMQLLLGVVNLLPAPPMDGGRVLRSMLARAHGMMRGARAALGVGQMIALPLTVGGVTLHSMPLMVLGVLVMVGPQMESDGLLLDSEVEAVTMRDVMLENFSTISASETLEGALESAMHSLQDVFPVVRGSNVVGAVSRQGIVDALERSGNGYVQGVMTRSLAVAAPGDSLVKTLRRMVGTGGVQMVPVVDGERVVGILTPQNLSHSMRMLHLRRRLLRRAE